MKKMFCFILILKTTEGFQLKGGQGKIFFSTLQLGLSNTGCLHHAAQVRTKDINDIQLMCDGREVGATSALVLNISPLQLHPKRVGSGFARATSDWKGLRIIVKLTIRADWPKLRW